MNQDLTVSLCYRFRYHNMLVTILDRKCVCVCVCVSVCVSVCVRVCVCL